MKVHGYHHYFCQISHNVIDRGPDIWTFLVSVIKKQAEYFDFFLRICIICPGVDDEIKNIRKGFIHLDPPLQILSPAKIHPILITEMEHSSNQYAASKFSPYRKASADLLNAANRKNMVHALLEVDIEATRKAIRKRRREKKEYLSLIGYIVYCVARAVDMDKGMHAYRDWRNRLICFEEVDVSITIEREIKGHREVIPKIIRNANHKDMFEISSEIKDAKTGEIKDAEVYKSIRNYLAIPAIIRRLVFRILDRFPVLMKKKAGTIMVTSSGVGGLTRAWGIPVASHTLNITVGGIARRIVEINNLPQSREHICLTVSFNHDIVDGAPASRFMRSFVKRIETEIFTQKS